MFQNILRTYDQYLTPSRRDLLRDLGLLLFRVSFGLMMALGHGLGKVQKIIDGNIQFADPLGIGVYPSLLLAGGAEFFCSLAIAAGLLTRLSAIPGFITMAVAALVVHGSDPFSNKEKALVYMFFYAVVFLSGPGKISADYFIRKKVLS
ncbi:MAG: DoxX family protein [Fibrobacterota bacterium]